MKNKLRLLFGYLRGFGNQKLTTNIEFEGSYIEYWDQIYRLAEDDKEIELSSSINDILKEIIINNINKFDSYIDYDYDNYWHLFVNIYPFKNEIVFRSEHKQMSQVSKEFEYTINDLNQNYQQKIQDIRNGYAPETGGDEVNKISFEFKTAWDDFKLFDFEFDNQLLRVNNYETYWLICNDLITRSEGTYWYDGPPFDGSILIWDDYIYVKYNSSFEDYVDTGMNLKIKLDAIK